MLPTFADPPLHSPLSPMPSDLRETAGFPRKPLGRTRTLRRAAARGAIAAVERIVVERTDAGFADSL